MPRPPSHREETPDDPSWDRDDADESPAARGADDPSERDDGPGIHDAHLTDDHEPDLTDCVHCGKRILAQAPQCHHCGTRFLGEAWEQRPVGNKHGPVTWVAVIALVLLVLVLIQTFG